MDNSGCRWYVDEDEQLKKLYVKYKMDISEIAQIHKRSTEAIKLRLIKLGLIQETVCNDSHNIVWNLLVEKYGHSLKPEKNVLKDMCAIVSVNILELSEKVNVLEAKLNKCKLEHVD